MAESKSSPWLPALLAAWLTALAASLGALFIGEVMGQAPCALCWHQRAMMFPLAVVLGVACLQDDGRAWRYGLPLAVVGGGIALWHNLLFFKVAPAPLEPCGAGPSCSSANMLLFGELPIPVLSLAAFVGIGVCLWIVRRKVSQ